MSDISLQTILDRSRQIQEDFYEIDGRLESQLAQGLIKNASALLNSNWRIGFMDMNREKPQAIRARLLHAVDCLLYSASLLSVQDIDSHSILHVVSDRQKMIADMHQTAENYFALPAEKPIVVLDIDGVIFPYPHVWNRFKEFFADSGLSLEKIKEQYRLSGIKASTPPLEGSNQLIKYFQSNGYIVILLSSRPVNLYPEVYRFTVKFLDRYNIKPDLLFFKDHKAIAEELENIWDRVVYFVDDEYEQLRNVKKKHPNVNCVHIDLKGISADVDYSFRSTLSFYEELINGQFSRTTDK